MSDYYKELTTWLEEYHPSIYDRWTELLQQIIEEKRLLDIEKDKEEIERRKPKIEELANWFIENKEWLDSLSNIENINAIELSFKLMLDAIEKNTDLTLQTIGTYQTAIRSIASNIPELHVVGYLKDGRRVITPFNSCWYHSHGDDVKFDSKTEYDWREEE
tara:strand:- start:8147 stop:8629 length:483 start_codon:yes stop_codon:yes gene_type:complete